MSHGKFNKLMDGKRQGVYHLSFSDAGGAANVAKTLVEFQSSKYGNVHFMNIISGSLYDKEILFKNPDLACSSFIDNYVLRKRNTETLYSNYRISYLNSNTKILKSSDKKIFHIHWLPGFIQAKQLNAFFNTTNKIIISLHDMWFFTGGCHQSGDCSNFIDGCKKCPIVKKPFRKIVEKNLDFKIKAFLNSSNVQVVATSKWILDKFMNSNIMTVNPPTLIFNPIETEIFKIESRRSFEFVDNTLTLGFISNHLHDKSKGSDKIKILISKISSELPNFKIRLIVVGNGKIELNGMGIELTHQGYLSSQKSLSRFYNQIDFLISLGSNETSSTVIKEAMSCGCPVISIQNESNIELLKNNQNSITGDSMEQLVSRFIYFLEHGNYRLLSFHARDFIVENFDVSVISELYSHLYYE